MLKEEEEKIIAEKIKSGLMSRKSLKQISKDLSIPYNKLVALKKKYLKDINFPKRIMDFESHKRNLRIVELWNNGETLQFIGDQFKITRERARQIISQQEKEFGLKVNNSRENIKSRKENNYKDFVEKYSDKIIEGYNSNLSNVEIADKYNVPSRYVSKIIKDLINNNKIKIRLIRKKEISPKKKKYFETILAMRKENYTLNQIASELMLSKIRISQLIDEMNNSGIYIPKKHSGNKLSDIEVNIRSKIIMDMKKEGKPMNEIANRLGLSLRAVSRHIDLYMEV